MTHPQFNSASLPLGARRSAFRPTPAWDIDGRRTNRLTMQFASAVAVQACHHMPARYSDQHPRKILTDPDNEITDI